jgi:hypothetical protein
MARHRADTARTDTVRDLRKKWVHLMEHERQRDVESGGRAAVADMYE